ncbi:DUF6308 family protein [Arthrobacter sp. MMS24-T111]
MEVPAILTERNLDAAAKLVHRYYAGTDKHGRTGTGSYFDGWAGRGDMETRDVLTDSDAIAVNMLGAPIPLKAWIALQEPTRAARVTDILRRIPTHVPLSSLTREQAIDLLTGSGPAMILRDELRRDAEAGLDIGAAAASRIMARKRSDLIPVWDITIGRVTGQRSSDTQWVDWHALLTDGTGLPERLAEIHKPSGIEQAISELRLMDVILWMFGKEPEFS